jgi:hypothetical protein
LLTGEGETEEKKRKEEKSERCTVVEEVTV